MLKKRLSDRVPEMYLEQAISSWPGAGITDLTVPSATQGHLRMNHTFNIAFTSAETQVKNQSLSVSLIHCYDVKN